MALFNIPKRKEVSITDIVKQAQEEKTEKPKIKLKSGTLLGKLEAIKETVKKNLGDVANDYLLITTDEDFINYCKKASMCEYVALDTETTGLDNMIADLVGVCIYGDGLKPAYVSVGHTSTVSEQLLSNQVSKQAIHDGLQYLIDNHTKFIFHNAYYDIVELINTCNVRVPVYYDTLIGASCLNENESHSLKYLYDKYVMNGDAGVHKFAELFDGIPINYVPPDVAGVYGAHDAVMTYDLFKFQLPYLTHNTEENKECKLDKLVDEFWNIELPMIDVIVDMKLYGMEFDFNRAQELKEKYTKLREEALTKFNEAVSVYKDDILLYNKVHSDKPLDYPLNYNSPDQIRVLFYDIAKIGAVYKKNPTGTGKEVIDAILHEDGLKNKPIFNIVTYLSDAKMYDKALNTFIDKLTEDAELHNGRIFANINLAATRTGRLSSSSPNMQQVSARLSDIRTMFIGGKDKVIISCDFSKQEPCVLASACGDDKLIKVFTDGLDIYSMIASMAFDTTYEDCLEFYSDGTTNHEGKERRSSSKKIVLGLMYSRGIASVAEQIHKSKEEAQKLFDNIFLKYPVMAKWMKDTVAQAYKDGYVETIFGRRRRLPELKLKRYEFHFKYDVDEATRKYYEAIYTKQLDSCKNLEEKDKLRAKIRDKTGLIIINNEPKIKKAEREIINFCIQGGASSISKRAMIRIHNNKRLRELGAHLIMSIHDENLVVCDKKDAYEVAKLVEKCSVDAGNMLPVPLSCDIAISDCWYGDEYDFDENYNLVKR